MQTQIHRVADLGSADRTELFRLFDQFYTHTDPERFQKDLSEKDWVIRMIDGDNLAGFSTQKWYKFHRDAHPVHILFSGDTIVHPDYWDRSQLAGAFGHLFLRLQEKSDQPLYWFLISKGFRTYRFLPVFFKRFCPRHDGKGTEFHPLLQALAAERFGNRYDPATGVIDFGGEREWANESVAGIPPHRASDPHISFFGRVNPRHLEGAELACLAPLYAENLTRCGRRVIERTDVEWYA